MHRVRKFVEVGSGQVGYAMTAATLSDVSNGGSGIRTLHLTSPTLFLTIPSSFLVLRTVLRDGHVMVPALKAKGK